MSHWVTGVRGCNWLFHLQRPWLKWTLFSPLVYVVHLLTLSQNLSSSQRSLMALTLKVAEAGCEWLIEAWASRPSPLLPPFVLRWVLLCYPGWSPTHGLKLSSCLSWGYRYVTTSDSRPPTFCVCVCGSTGAWTQGLTLLGRYSTTLAILPVLFCFDGIGVW
jgi:hypothetical protein